MNATNGNGSFRSEAAPRRIVTLDIETVPQHAPGGPCPTYERAVRKNKRDPKCTCALDAKYGRVVCIGLFIDDGEKVTPELIISDNEAELLKRYWQALRETDLLVGHNVMGFDLMFLRQRCCILWQADRGTQPSFDVNLKKYYTDQVADIMQMWTNWDYKFEGAGLNDICEALGIEGDGSWEDGESHGAQVAAWWAARDYNSVARGCMNDVRRSYLAWCRMKYREPLGAVVAPAPTLFETQLRESLRQRKAVPVGAGKPPAQAPMYFDAPISGGEIYKGACEARPHDPRPATTLQASAHQNDRPRGGRRRKPAREKAIVYIETGGLLTLSGDTFPVKDDLKALGARCSKEGEQWVWSIPPRCYGPVAELCGRTGIRLVPGEGGQR